MQANENPFSEKINPPGVSSAVFNLCQNTLDKFYSISSEEKIFKNLNELLCLRESVLRRILTGQTLPITIEPSLVDALIETLAVMVVVEPEFETYKHDIYRVFPMAPRNRNAVDYHDIENKVSSALSLVGKRKTFVLGVGRDLKTILLSLERGDELVIVDCDGKILKEIKTRIYRSFPDQASQIVWETTSFSDPDFMRRYCNAADQIYLLHNNDMTAAACVFNILKAGGVVITQDRGDISPQFTKAFSPEFILLHQYQEALPAFDTPWAHINPSGNVINVIQRDPHSPLAGKFCMTVPEGVRRAYEENVKHGFVPLRWLTEVEIRTL